MWKNVVEQGKPQMTIWRMCIAFWIPEATNTPTQVLQYLLLFHWSNGYMNTPQCYIMHTLPVLSHLAWTFNF
jgi:hypothetical protein